MLTLAVSPQARREYACKATSYPRLRSTCWLAAAAVMIASSAQGVVVNQPMTQVAGSIREITVAGNGTVYALSTTVNGVAPSGVKNYTIHRWNESRKDWENIPGQAHKIAAAPDGTLWIVTAQGAFWRWNNSRSSFEQMPGGGSSIAIGGDGSIYVNGGAPADGNYNNPIYKWNGSGWASATGESMTLAVEPLGTPWALTAAGILFRRHPDPRVGWATVPGDIKMTSLAISPSGHVWATGSDNISGGNRSTYQWNGQTWVLTNAQSVRVAVEPNGRPWFVTAQGTVWRGEPQNVPMQLFGRVTPPPPAPPAPAASADDDICWKTTSTRGVGTVPSYCPQGTVQDATGYLCYPQCQAGYNGVGPICWDFPKSYGRGAGSIKDGCGIGNEYDAGLCYPDCPKNSDGVGPVCWGTCGGKYPVNCGAACAVSDLHCGKAIVNMITSVADSAISTFGMVVTAGASTAASAAFRTAAKSSISAGSKAATKAGLKAYLIAQAKELGRDIAEGEAESLAVSAAENFLQSAAGGDTGFDPTTLDPTGIASVVQAFNKPMCEPQLIGTVTPADPLTTINTTVFAISNDNRLWANSGWVWVAVPGAQSTKYVTVAHDGTIWRLDVNGLPQAWNGTGWTQFGTQAGFKAIATAGNRKVWAVGGDGAFYKFDGKQFTRVDPKPVALRVNTSNVFDPVALENVSVGLDGNVYASGRVPSGQVAVLKWDFQGERFRTMFYGVSNSTAISATAKLYMISAEGQMATLDSTHILNAVGNSPTGVKATAAGGSGEIWFLNASNQPNRIVKFIPGQGNLAPTIDTAPFDVNSFKQIAVR